MTAPRYARLAGKVLARHGMEGRIRVPRPVEASARSEAISALERAIAERARRRRTQRRVVTLLAVAAVALLGAGGARLALRPKVSVVQAPAQVERTPPELVVHPSGDGAQVVGGSTPAVGSGQALGPGARVVALPHGRALLAFSSGTQVNVEEGGDVSIEEAGTTHVLALREGALRADVVPLKAGERFMIRTSDTEIEVHGTSFRVATTIPSATCGNGTPTRVTVYEGVVTVRHGAAADRVPAGESWPQNCPGRTPSVAARSAETARTPPLPRPPSREAHPGPTRAEGPSLLEQNDAFAGAMSAKRRGDLSGAVDRFSAFVAAYPTSALAESAAAQRMKLLVDLDRGRAVASARDYLARYPSGFAKRDADAILAEGR